MVRLEGLRLAMSLGGSGSFATVYWSTGSGLAAVLDYFDNLSTKYLQKIIPPENILNRLGYMALEQSNYEEAIRIFKLNVETFPLSANVYDSLGEALLKAGDSTNAVINYEKSLKLNPEDTNAARALLRLRSAE